MQASERNSHSREGRVRDSSAHGGKDWTGGTHFLEMAKEGACQARERRRSGERHSQT